MSLPEFLQYIGTLAGVNVAVNFISSFLADWWPWYQALAEKPKRLVMMVLSFILPVLGTVGLYLLGELELNTDTVWAGLTAAFMASFAGYFSSQVAHTRSLRGKPFQFPGELIPLKEKVYDFADRNVPPGAVLKEVADGGKKWIVLE